MEIKFIHDSLSDYFAGGHLKRTIEDDPSWQESLDPLVKDKDTYNRWRSAFGQLSELASDTQVNELVKWGKNWQLEKNLFGLDWLPRLYLIRQRYDDLSNILTDLVFIEAKCAAGMTYDLVEDYNRLSVGRARPGPPILTALKWQGKFGIWCPFCLAWSKITEKQLGKVIECSVCKMEIRMNAFIIDTLWQPCGPERIIPKQKATVAKLPQEVSDFADFIKSQAHILETLPKARILNRNQNLVFQQAANQPDNTAPFRVALGRWQSGQEKRPWLRYINEPFGKPTSVIDLRSIYYKGATRIGRSVKALAVTPNNRDVVSACSDGLVIVLDLQTGRVVSIFEIGHDEVSALAVMPDSRQFVSLHKEELRLWDLQAGKIVRKFVVCHGYSGLRRTTLAVTPDGHHVLSASYGRTLHIWDVQTAEEIAIFAVDHDTETLAVTPDGRCVVSASRDIRAWDLQTGKEVWRFASNAGNANTLAVTPDSRYVITQSHYGFILLDIKTGQQIRSFVMNRRATMLAVTPDNRYVVSGYSWDKELCVLDLQTGEKVWSPYAHEGRLTALAVTPDSRYVVSASREGRLKVWDFQRSKKIRRFASHHSSVRALAVTTDARYVISGLDKGNLEVWDLQTGTKAYSRVAGADDVVALAVTLDSHHVVSGSFRGELYIFELQTGKKIWGAHIRGCPPVTGLAVTPDSRYVVSGSLNRTLEIWDLHTGREVRTLASGCEPMGALAVTPDYRYIVTADHLGSLIVRDFHTGQKVRKLEIGHVAVALAVTPDGCYVISVHNDYGGVLNVLDFSNGEVIGRLCLLGERGLLCCAVARDGVTIIVGTKNGTVFSSDWRTWTDRR